MKRIRLIFFITCITFLISVSEIKAQYKFNPAQPKIGRPLGNRIINLYTFTSKSISANSVDFKNNISIHQSGESLSSSNIPSPTAIEVVSRRTGNSRYFIDADTASKFYIVQANENINYQKNGQWLVIDKRLTPLSATLFEAGDQQEPVGFDRNKKQAYIKTLTGIVYFNNWQLIGRNGATENILAQADWTHFSAGDDGIKITGIFPGVDAQMIIRQGAVKTNFIIKSNQFQHYEQLLFSDEFHSDNGGQLKFSDGSTDNEKIGAVDFSTGQQMVAHIDKAVMYAEKDPADTYKLLVYNLAVNYLRIVIDAKELNHQLKTSDVIIDPLVSSTGILALSNITGSMGNCADPLLVCKYDLQVQTPPKATFTRVAMQFGFTSHYPARLRDGFWNVNLGACSVGYFGIDPTLPDSIKNAQGTISTQGNWGDIPELISCLPPPACVPQTVTFTLGFANSVCNTSIVGCSDVYVSAEEPFQILIEGRTLEMKTMSSPDTMCQGSNATIAATGIYGVPPYNYSWNNSAGNDSTETVSPAATTNYTITITDQCGNTADSTVNIVVIPKVAPSVTVSAKGSLCTGADTLVLTTHSPTTAASLTKISWYDGNLIDHSNYNPNIDTTFIPTAAGKYSAIITSTAGCMATVDSIELALGVQPEVTITSSETSFCIGDTIVFKATPSNGGLAPSYQWQVNGMDVGTNSTTFTDIVLHDSDIITCILTSNATCAISSTITSNNIKISKGGVTAPYAYVVDDLNNSIDIVNLLTNSLVATVPVDSYPIFSLSNSNRNYLYVTYGNKYITVINTITNAIVSTIPVLGAGNICLSPDKSKLYVITDIIVGTNNVSSIIVINTATNAIISTIASHTGISGEYGDMCISPDGSKLYIATTEKSLDVMNTTTDLIESTIPLSTAPLNLIINSTGSELYMSSNGNFVTAINTSTYAMTNIPLPEYRADGMILSPDNSKLYVAVGDMIVTINTATNAVINTIQPDGVGAFQADGINISTDGSKLYFLDYISHSLKTLDLSSNTVTAQVNNTGQPYIITGLLETGYAGSNCPPIITSFNSTTVCGSMDTVTVVGHDLTGVFSVSFGGIAASFFKVINDSTIKALPGNGASGNVSVINSGGMDTLGGFTYITPVIPAIAITSNPATAICAGTNITFTAMITNGGVAPSYQWKLDGVNVGTNSSTYSNAALADNDSVSCTLTSSVTCIVLTVPVSNKIIVAVNPIVTPAVSIVASDNNICSGTPVTFTATPVNGGTNPSYQWLVNGSSVGTNNAGFTSASLLNGDLISCVLTSNVSCPTIPTTATSNIITMVINPIIAPSINILADTNSVCYGTPVTFIANTTNGGSSALYQWEVNGNVAGDNTSTYNSSTLQNNDIISCTLISSLGCTAPVVSNTINAIIYPLPTLQMGTDKTIPIGTSVTLDITVTGNINSYLWQPENSLNDAALKEPVATPIENTTYTVEITTVNKCKVSGSMAVKVYAKLLMPNAFTPNGDKNDDIFGIPPSIAAYIKINYFSIYDRWGNEIFTTKDPNKGWDGTYFGQPETMGNYVWMIIYPDPVTGNNTVEKGTVLLIR
jgi:gliding motility-associated-like protein